MSCFFEIAVADETLDRTDVIGQLLGEGKRLSDQTRDALSQRAVKPLDMVGDASLLVDEEMLLFGDHTLVRTPAIGIEGSMLTVALGYGLPKRFGTLTASVADMEGDDLPAFDLESHPYPLLVGFLADEAEHFIDFGCKRTDD